MKIRGRRDNRPSISKNEASSHNRPLARQDRLICEQLDDGIVVYDSETQQAHHLDPAAAAVWLACDGSRSTAEIARAAQLPADLTLSTIARPEAIELLTGAASDDGPTRRSLLGRAAKLGGAALLAAPVISTVVVPSAMAGTSNLPTITFDGGSSAATPGTAGQTLNYQISPTGATGTFPANGSGVLYLYPDGTADATGTKSNIYIEMTYSSSSQTGKYYFRLFNRTTETAAYVFTDNGNSSNSGGGAIPTGGSEVDTPMVSSGEQITLTVSYTS